MSLHRGFFLALAFLSSAAYGAKKDVCKVALSTEKTTQSASLAKKELSKSEIAAFTDDLHKNLAEMNTRVTERVYNLTGPEGTRYFNVSVLGEGTDSGDSILAISERINDISRDLMPSDAGILERTGENVSGVTGMIKGLVRRMGSSAPRTLQEWTKAYETELPNLDLLVKRMKEKVEEVRNRAQISRGEVEGMRTAVEEMMNDLNSLYSVQADIKEQIAALPPGSDEQAAGLTRSLLEPVNTQIANLEEQKANLLLIGTQKSALLDLVDGVVDTAMRRTNIAVPALRNAFRVASDAQTMKRLLDASARLAANTKSVMTFTNNAIESITASTQAARRGSVTSVEDLREVGSQLQKIIEDRRNSDLEINPELEAKVNELRQLQLSFESK